MSEHLRHTALISGFLLGASWVGIAQAQTIPPAPSPVSQTTQGSGQSDGDIVVTASKREERASDFAGAIKAFSGDSLLDGGLTSLKDYAGFTPGLQVNTNRGGAAPVIRGITTGADNGTLVGIVVNGAQIGSSATASSGSVDSLDLDPLDLTRVEVLKGPQGTTYGANTLSGIVSYTLRDPDLNAVSATMRGEVYGTRHGGTSGSIRGTASMPLVQDAVGIRISAYRAYDAGFVDNDVRGISDQNRHKKWEVSGSVLLKPTPALRIMASGFYQRTDDVLDTVIYGSDGQPRDGDLRYDDYLAPRYRKTVRVVIGTVDYDLGGATLSSITGYQHIDSRYDLNATSGALTGALPLLAAFGGPVIANPHATLATSATDLDKVTQEVRLASSAGRPLSWMVGGYFAHESAPNPQDITVTDTSGVPLPSTSPNLRFFLRPRYTEYAGFANATYAIARRLDVTGGIRFSRIEQTFDQSFSGSDANAYNVLLTFLNVPGTPLQAPQGKSRESVLNYLATVRYHFADDGMIFARFATGYRPGGANIAVQGLPSTFDRDKTQNYELGIKSKLFDGHASIDLTGYYTRWSDIIVSVGAGGINGFGNAGNAEVYGAEGSLAIRPATGLSLTGTLAYSHAEFLDTTPVVQRGDRLPYNPRFSGSIALDYRAPVGGEWTGVFNLSSRLSGSRDAFPEHNPIAPNYVLPGYGLVDLRVGVESARLDLSLFVRNLTGKRAQLSAWTFYGINEVTVARPTSIGATLTAHY